jgi:hypothetical protein
MTALPAATAAAARPSARFWNDTPGFAGLTVAIALAAVPLAAALALDPRSLSGEPVWLKPLKFHLALSVYLGTLAAFARWLPAGLTATRGWRRYEAVVCAAVLAELLWIGGAAALGVRSHFNVGTPLWSALYGLMGVLAVTLTSAALVMGVAIARNRASGLPPALHLGLWLGLVLTFVLTVAVAGRLSAGAGHHVGTPATGAVVPLMGWSREVGDLRVAHFLATHALHAVPLAALAALALPRGLQRPAVWLAAAGWTALVALTFVQALAGRPLY